jgi:hypothetical protein
MGSPRETKLPYSESGQARDEASLEYCICDNVQSGQAKCRYNGSDR